MNKQREELAEAQAETEVDGKADGDSAGSLICADKFRMRMGERDSAIGAETQSRSLKSMKKRRLTPLTPSYAHAILPCRCDSLMLTTFSHADTY